MRAADYGHDKTVEVLAEAGADMLMKDNDSQGKKLKNEQFNKF